MNKLALCIPLLLAACSKQEEAKPAPTPATTTGARYEIAVTEKGFEPGDVAVPVAKQVTIVFDRKTDATCAKQIVLDTGDGNKIQKDLPLNTPVEIATTFPKAGKLTYACSMDMMKGTITVQ
jgi:plastocyanin domain-containing protein